MTDPASVAGTAAKALATVSRFKPWAVVKRHDRLAHEQYEDLITWARDDMQKEARGLDEVKERLNAQNLLYRRTARSRVEPCAGRVRCPLARSEAAG